MADAEEFRCFVGGLSWSTSDRKLKDSFEKFGKLLEARPKPSPNLSEFIQPGVPSSVVPSSSARERSRSTKQICSRKGERLREEP
ncbi:hypothetical protein K1719_002725 [Acacia pycnantha]|nr:hypothetical protein K1719_002725 [Acacia pycnantha]